MKIPKAYLEASSKSKAKDIVHYNKLVAATSLDDSLQTHVVGNIGRTEEVMDAEKEEPVKQVASKDVVPKPGKTNK